MTFYIYLIGIIDDILYLLGVLTWAATIGFVIFFISFIVNSIDKNDELQLSARFLKIFATVLIIVVPLVVLIPSSKTVAAMVLIPAIAQNEQIQNIGANGLKVLEKLTGQYLEELIDEELVEK